MPTLIVVSKSTPVAVFHFIISNYVRWMEGTVQRIATTNSCFHVVSRGKSPASGAVTCILGEGGGGPGGIVLGGNSPGGIILGWQYSGEIVLGVIVWGKLSSGGNFPGGNGPAGNCSATEKLVA